MVEQHEWYSLLSIVTSSLSLVLALLVWRRYPGKRAASTFVAAMSFFLLAAVCSYFVRSGFVTGAFGPALVWSSRLFYFVHMLAVGYTAAFVGMYFYGFAVFRRRAVGTFLNLSLGAAAVLVSALVTERTTPVGVIPATTNARLALATISTLYGALMLTTIGRTLWVNTDPVVRKQALVMLGGILVHGASAETYAYLRAEGEFPVPFLTASALVMASTFTVAILRFRMFEVAPRPQSPEPLPRKFPLRPGRAYLVRERAADVAFRALAEAGRRGSPTLVVTRAPPNRVREDFDLPNSPVLWLTTEVGSNRVPPTDPALLVRLVGEFADLAEKPVVAFEGLEYLTGYLGFDGAAKAVQAIRDRLAEREGILLLSLNPGAFEEPQLAVLSRDFERLEGPAETAVEDVYVIHASGILITRATRTEKQETDRDVMAGTLTVILDFVRLSFAEGSEQLRQLDLGGKTVAIERTRNLILAVMFRGKEPADLREEMRVFLSRCERRYGTILPKWSGIADEVPGLHAMTWRLLA